MLKYLEDSEVLKVSPRELKEQVLSPDDSIFRKVRGRREVRNAKKLCQIFRQGAIEVPIAILARWEEHVKGLVVLERHCLVLREEVEHLSERQGVLAFLMEGRTENQKTFRGRSSRSYELEEQTK